MFLENASGGLRDVTTIEWDHIIAYILDISPLTPLAWLLAILGPNTLHLTGSELENVNNRSRNLL